MFLSPAEVEHLTGYKKASCQSRWLWEHGITHYINAQGRVIVVRSAVEQPSSDQPQAEPRFDHVA